MNKKLAIPLLAAAALVGGAGAGYASLASADTTSTNQTASGMHTEKRHGVGGVVVSVNGTTITLTGKDGATYTVDASKVSSVTKMQTVPLSGIAVGDTLMVGGAVNGTSVVAEHIMDGVVPPGGFGKGGEHPMAPGVQGVVSAVNGTTLTVSGKDGTTYTVLADNAKVMKSTAGEKPVSSSLGAVLVGDTVGIRGAKSGQTITAEMIFDGIPKGPGRGMMHARGEDK